MDEAPAILLVYTVAGTQRIAHRCVIAAAAGVQPSMTLAHARAMLTDVSIHVEPFDEQRDHKSLKAFASWALRFSPIVAPDPPAGLLLDINGCQRLFHGERRLVNLIANTVQWLNIHARIATAETYGCAWAAARFGESDRSIIPDGAEIDTLTPLPIESLRIDDDIIEALREVGIEHIGHLIELPRLELASRFGPDLLLRLDQATGEAIEAIEPIRPIHTPRVEREFDGPVKQLESVMITVRELIGQLAASLQQRESGVSTLHLTLERSDAGPVCKTIELSRPSRDCGHLWSMLQPRVEKINLGFGVDRIILTASKTGSLRHRQMSRWHGDASSDNDGSPLDQARGEFIDTVGGRLGTQRAVRIEMMQSHVPEQAFRRQPVMRRPSHGREHNAMEVTPSERPSILFDRPESIDVMAMTPDGPPSWMRWRGEEQAVAAASGPERIAGQWWDDVIRDAPTTFSREPKASASASRDYFKVQDEAGRWLWIFRSLDTGLWFVHGQWA